MKTKVSLTRVPLPAHLSAFEGSLFDERKAWGTREIRANYSRGHHYIESVADLKAVLRHGNVAWPGLYPLYLVMSDGDAMCFSCALKEFRTIVVSMLANDNDGWRVIGCEINYEDPSLFCCHSGERIESAYAEDQAEDKNPATSQPDAKETVSAN